jgi:tRNA(Ile)-lysidine synthase
MIEQVQKTIEQYEMLASGQDVVAAVSGGPDSVVMLDCLLRLGYRPIVAHLHHGLRGKEADADEDFVRRLAEELMLPIYVKWVDTAVLAKENGVSIEEAGRSARYLFFWDIMEQTGCTRTALAHHSDDQAETVLQHVLRGSGPEGLKGMEPVRDGVFIRPMLYVSRADILAYCAERGLSYRTDATNEDTDYQRNSIRHELLPQLEQYNPKIREAMCRTAEIIREEDACMAEYGGKLYAEMAVLEDAAILLPIEKLNGVPTAMRRRILPRAISATGSMRDVGYDHIEGILDLLTGPGSALQLPGGIRVEAKGKTLRFFVEEKEEPCPPYEYNLPVPGSADVPEAGVRIICEEAATPHFDENTVCVDADKVLGPLRVRNRRRGDRFFPYNGPGQKKLKDFLIDEKIPRAKRDRIPLITDDQDILWVAGLRTADPYKVDEMTKRLLKLSIHGEQ